MAIRNLSLSDSVSSKVLRALRRGTSRRLSGFTLAELIVVVSILAVLATVGFLALSGYQQDAKKAVASTNVRSVYTAISTESSVTGYSSRYYVIHDPNYALTGSVIVFDSIPAPMAGGDWNAPDTNYSAGNPDYAKLKLDPEKFRIVSVATRTADLLAAAASPFFASAGAAATADPSYLLVGAVDATDTSGDKDRVRSYVQVAAILPSGETAVTGDYPVTATGGSAPGLIKDIANVGSSTGTLIDGATIGSVPGCDADGDFSGYDVPAMESGESKPVLKTVTNGEVNGTAYCSFGALSVSSEAATCDSGYVPASGPSCVENVCGGSVPANAAASVGGTQAVGTDWHYSATAGTCTFDCNADHSWDGSACRPDCTGPRAGLAYDYHGGYAGQYALSSIPALVHGASGNFSGTGSFGDSLSSTDGELTAAFAYACTDGVLAKDSTNGTGSCASPNYTWNGSWSAPACAGDSVPNQACTTPPTGAVANTAATITQTWSGATLVPSLTSVYNEMASSTECRYKCAAGYAWDAGTSSCLPSVSGACGPADGVPTVSAPSSGLCSAGTAGTVSSTGTGHLWACSGLYGWISANCSAPLPAQVAGSLRLNGANAYLSRTPASAGNRKTSTWSGWVKRTKTGTEQSVITAGSSSSSSPYETDLRFSSNDTITFTWNGAGVSVGDRFQSSMLFRDTSAWYHVVLRLDMDNAARSERCKVYVNGTQIQMNAIGGSAGNAEGAWNANGYPHAIGTSSWDWAAYVSAYLADVHFIDGQALPASSFGETDPASGSWRPKAYAGTYGNNGFRLDFSDVSSLTSGSNVGLGKDSSGNGNYWNTSNVALADAVLDSPTNNFTTLNPLQTGSYSSLSLGNLKTAGNISTNSAVSVWTVSVNSGKWYWEAVQWTVSTEMIGVATKPVTNPSALINAETFPTTYGVGARYNGYVAGISGEIQAVSGFSWVANDVIGIALDADNGAVYYSKNGIWLNSGNPTSWSAKTGAFSKYAQDSARMATPTFGSYNGGYALANFGQGGQSGLTYYSDAGGSFKHAPPTGFKALSTKNMPTPAITKPSQHFDVLTYAGSSASQTISNLGFQPDFVWIKDRTVARQNDLYDSVRGPSKRLYSNFTDAEGLNTEWLQSFNSNGFSLGTSVHDNGPGENYVAWNWRAGGAASPNAAGTISSQVSANPTAGFSIVTYTGNGATNATVGHGLNAVPSMIVVKSTNGASDWEVMHKSLPTNYGLRLDTTSAQINLPSATAGGGLSTSPTSSTFSFVSGTSNANNVNENTRTWVAYVFSEVPGFSKFGSYVGNGSADGPFVYTGFKPKYVLIKDITAASSWLVRDSVRSSQNPNNLNLNPNNSQAEGTTDTPAASHITDLLSNGFKLRANGGADNASGRTYIYAAFAEVPFGGAGISPANAR